MNFFQTLLTDFWEFTELCMQSRLIPALFLFGRQDAGIPHGALQ